MALMPKLKGFSKLATAPLSFRQLMIWFVGMIVVMLVFLMLYEAVGVPWLIWLWFPMGFAAAYSLRWFIQSRFPGAKAPPL